MRPCGDGPGWPDVEGNGLGGNCIGLLPIELLVVLFSFHRLGVSFVLFFFLRLVYVFVVDWLIWCVILAVSCYGLVDFFVRCAQLLFQISFCDFIIFQHCF